MGLNLGATATFLTSTYFVVLEPTNTPWIMDVGCTVPVVVNHRSSDVSLGCRSKLHRVILILNLDS